MYREIVVYLEEDYSKFEVIYLHEDLSPEEITEKINEKFDIWYYYDIF